MSEMSLSRLYRRLVSERAQPAVDSADLVAVAAGSASADEIDSARRDRVVASLAASSPHADLARMLHALQPASESLAEDVGERGRSAHPARVREQRVAAGARRGHRVHRLRWAGGIAACLSVALGLWSWHHEDAQQHAVIATRSASASDRIFASNDVIFSSSSDAHQQEHRNGGRGDELFRGHFSG
jgi:hypothetical protein